MRIQIKTGLMRLLGQGIALAVVAVVGATTVFAADVVVSFDVNLGGGASGFADRILEDAELPNPADVTARWHLIENGATQMGLTTAPAQKYAGNRSLAYTQAPGQMSWEYFVDGRTNLTSYRQLIYFMKASGTGVTAKVALVEASGEVWIQRNAQTVNTTYTVMGADLNASEYEVSGTPVDGTLDLTNIIEIRLITTGTGQSIFADNLTLTISRAADFSAVGGPILISRNSRPQNPIESGILANFEGASTSSSDGGNDTRSVLSTQPNFLSLSAVNGLTSGGLAISTVFKPENAVSAEVFAGSNAARIDIPFNNQAVSAVNWGVLLNEQQTNGAAVNPTMVPMNLSTWDYISLYARKANASDSDVQFAVAFAEGGADAEQEIWISDRMKLNSATYQRFEVGLNNVALRLSTDGAQNGNRVLNLDNVKAVYYFFYKTSDNNQPQAIYLDEILKSNTDTLAPQLGDLTLTNRTLTRGDFQIRVPVSDGGGMDYAARPTVTLAQGANVVGVNVVSYTNGSLLLAGTMPESITGGTVQLNVTGIRDLAGNTARLTQELQFNPLFVPLPNNQTVLTFFDFGQKYTVAGTPTVVDDLTRLDLTDEPPFDAPLVRNTQITGLNFTNGLTFNLTDTTVFQNSTSSQAGMGALKVNLAFGDGTDFATPRGDSASVSNWGAILLHRNRDQSAFNLAGFRTLGFYAKSKDASAPITMAIGFEEDNGNTAINERWVSERFTLTNAYELYSVGLDNKALTLDVTGPTGGNKTFDAARIKSVYYFIYRGTATGNAEVYMDMVHTRIDDVKPVVTDVTTTSQADTFTLEASIQELGGVGAVQPTITVTRISDDTVVPVTITQFTNSKLTVTGTLPIGQVPVTVVVSNVIDQSGNVSLPFTKAIAISGRNNPENPEAPGFTVVRDGNIARVTHFGPNNENNTFEIQNHTVSTVLDFSTLTDKLPESVASIKLVHDFGTGADVNGQPNWGSLLIQNKSDSSAYNFTGAQTLAMVVKSNAPSGSVEFAVALQDSDNEVWISRRVTLPTDFKRFGFGLNEQIFKLDTAGTVGNRQLDLNGVKNIFYFVFRGATTGNATVWIDDVKTANDTDRPVYVTSNVVANPIANSFTIKPHFDELGGLSTTLRPTVAVVANGEAVADAALQFVNDEWIITGTVPASANRVVATVSIRNVTDYYGNVRDVVSDFIVSWNNGEIPVHELKSMTGLNLFTATNTLAAGDGFAGLTLNFNAGNSDNTQPGFNWGEGIIITPTVEASAAVVSLYERSLQTQTATLGYLTYDIKSSINAPVKTYLVAVERSENGRKEIWKQREFSFVSSDAFFTSGVTINASAFVLDTVNGDVLNNRIDLNNIESIQLVVDRNNASANPVTLTLKNIVLRKQDTRNSRLVTVLDRFDTEVVVPTDNSNSTQTVTGNLVPGATVVEVILPDGSVIPATVVGNTWTVTIPNLAPGDNPIRVVFFDENHNPVNATDAVITFNPPAAVEPASVPRLLAESVNTSVTSPAIYGTVSAGTVQVKLYINGSPVATIASKAVTRNIQVTSLVTSPKTIVGSADQPNYFVFDNIRFDNTRDARISVAGIDARGRETSRSAEIIVKWGVRSSLRVPGASSVAGPIYVDFPVGSLASDVAPIIDTNHEPSEYPITVAYRRLATGPASLVDITIGQALQSQRYAIVSIPIPAGSTNRVEPWYFNPATKTWTQEGISNIEIVDRLAVDGVGDTDEKYIRFRVTHFSLFGVLDVVDQTAPTVNSVKFDDKTIEAGDYIKTSAKIKFTISEPQVGDSGVGAWSIKMIKIDTATLATSDVTGVSNSGNGNGATGNTLVTANMNLNKLGGGQYVAQLTVADLNANTTVYKSPTFNIEAGFQVANVLNGPNPFNPNRQSTNIQYQLSQDADVTIYVYSISGEKLWETKLIKGQTNGTAGFNTVQWNGRNKYGELVANGVYVAYILCDNGSEKIVKKVKIAVLK